MLKQRCSTGEEQDSRFRSMYFTRPSGRLIRFLVIISTLVFFSSTLSGQERQPDVEEAKNITLTVISELSRGDTRAVLDKLTPELQSSPAIEYVLREGRGLRSVASPIASERRGMVFVAAPANRGSSNDNWVLEVEFWLTRKISRIRLVPANYWQPDPSKFSVSAEALFSTSDFGKARTQMRSSQRRSDAAADYVLKSSWIQTDNLHVRFKIPTALKVSKKRTSVRLGSLFNSEFPVDYIAATDSQSGIFTFVAVGYPFYSTRLFTAQSGDLADDAYRDWSRDGTLPEIGSIASRYSRPESSALTALARPVKTSEVLVNGEPYKISWVQILELLPDNTYEFVLAIVGHPLDGGDRDADLFEPVFSSLELNNGRYASSTDLRGNNPLGKYESKSSSLRMLAVKLLRSDRINEARIALEVAKEEEYLSYMKRPRRSPNPQHVTGARMLMPPPFAIQFASWRPSLPDCKKDYSELRDQLSDLAAEASRLGNKRQRTRDDELRLMELRDQLDCAGKEYQKTLLKLFDTTENVEEKVSKYHHTPKLRALAGQLQGLGQGANGTAALLYTLITKDEYWVILVAPDVIIARSKRLTDDNFASKIRTFRAQLQNSALDPLPLARELYADLVHPIAGDLERLGVGTLVWSLDRELRYLPVAALHDGVSYLAQKFAHVIYTPAAASRWLEPTPLLPGVGFGVSEGSSPLPSVMDELFGIFGNQAKGQKPILTGTILSNQDFSRNSLRREVVRAEPRGLRSLHIASHFLLRPGPHSKSESFLLLGGDERLTVEQLDDGSLNFFKGVHLLVLSACNTAVASDQGQDENGVEVESFGVLAQEQGATSVLATLWPVNDPATAVIMQSFYRNWVGAKMSKASALRMAQISMIRGDLKAAGKGGGCRAEPFGRTPDKNEFKCDPNAPYSHPYFWSPFVLIGNWR